MPSLKDNLLLQKESLELSVAQSSFSFKTFLQGFPRGKKILLMILAVSLIPAIVGVRLGTQYVTEKRLSQNLTTAHPSFVSAKAPTIGAVQIFNSGQGWFSAAALVTNENLDLGASSAPYQFAFTDSQGQTVTATGTTFLLPDQKKYVVAARVDSKNVLTRGELSFGEIKWQKRLTVPQVSLKAAAPFLSNDPDTGDLVVEGAVVNDSAYELATVRLVFLLYDHSNNLITVSQRDEFNIPSFGRRAYKQTWPNLFASDVAKVVVQPDTNTLDINNLIAR